MSPRGMLPTGGHRGMVDGTEDDGGGGGGITDITSNDGTVTVTNPHGPTVDLSVPNGLGSIDTSLMADGQLGWVYAAGKMLPGNNLDAKAANVLAAFSGGKLRNSGVWPLAFTTQGGQPANGAPVYLAAATDDGGTAVGKVTATKPTVGMPFPAYPQQFTQNAVRVGKCVDNSAYAGPKTCLVELSLPAMVEPQALVPNQNLQGAEWRGFATAGNFFLTASDAVNPDQFALRAGQTLLILFSVESGPFSGLNDVISNYKAATDGWQFGQHGGQWELLVVTASALTGACNLGIGAAVNGLNLACFAVDPGGVIRGCINGKNYKGNGFYTSIPTPDGTYNLNIGGGVPGQDGFPQGGVYAVAMLNRAASDAELIAWSGAPYAQPPPTPATQTSLIIGGPIPLLGQTNRYQLPPAVINDPALLWSTNAMGATLAPSAPPALAGPQGTSFTFANAGEGAVQVAGRQVTLYRNLAGQMLDTEPAIYDSRGYPRTDAGARIALTITDVADLLDLCIGWTNDDFDDSDNGAASMFINGALQSAIAIDGQNPTGNVEYFYPNLSGLTFGAGPWLVEFVVPDRIRRSQTYYAGACLPELLGPANATFQTPATASRLVLIGDADAIGHDTGISGEPFGNSVTTQLRSDFPGRVTCHSQTNGGIFAAWQYGNGASMDPFAQRIVAAALEGNPATTTLYFIQCFYADYFEANWSPAAFGAHYALLIDAVHALQPTWTIYVDHPIQAAYDAVANSNGDTLAAFTAQIVALATGRPWLHVVNSRGPNAITFAPGASIPNAHPTQTGGTAAWKANIKLILGY